MLNVTSFLTQRWMLKHTILKITNHKTKPRSVFRTVYPQVCLAQKRVNTEKSTFEDLDLPPGMFTTETGQHWKIQFWRHGSTFRYVYHRNGSTLKNPILKTWIYLQVCLAQKRVNTEKSTFEDMDLPSGVRLQQKRVNTEKSMFEHMELPSAVCLLQQRFRPEKYSSLHLHVGSTQTRATRCTKSPIVACLKVCWMSLLLLCMAERMLSTPPVFCDFACAFSFPLFLAFQWYCNIFIISECVQWKSRNDARHASSTHKITHTSLHK